jgi:hypothetical protein
VSWHYVLAERPDARGRPLIEFPGYTYRIIVTIVPYDAELVTWMYTGPDDREDRIKELKDVLSLEVDFPGFNGHLGGDR